MKTVFTFTFLFISTFISGQCPSTPTQVAINTIGKLLDTGDQLIKVTVLDYPDMMVDDANHMSWLNTETEAPNSQIDYQTFSTIGIIDIHIKNPLDTESCDQDRQIEIVTTLPVQWLKSLQVKHSHKGVLLTWSTESEVNNSHFVIEQSSNKEDFINLDRLSSKSSGGSEYSYLHTNPSSGKNYYRIKQMDNDGRYSLSEIVGITFEGGSLYVYPNPSKGLIDINSSTEDVLQIFNHYGQMMEELKMLEGKNQLELHHLQAGMYIFKTESGKALRWVKM